MKYHFKVHKEKDGYWAEGVEISWANTQAETMKELFGNMKEVLELCLEEPDDRATFIPPLPQATVKGKNIVEVAPDPQVALAAMLRRERLLGNLTQRQAMARMGFKNLIQYQRLESAKTANAELSTLAKVKKAFPAFSLDLVLG